MKIAYYGNFGPFNSESYIIKELRAQQHMVLQINKAENVPNIKGYDFFLYHKGGPGFFKLIEQCNRQHILKVCWAFDIFFDIPTYIKRSEIDYKTIAQANILFTTDAGHEIEWKRLVNDWHVLRQGCPIELLSFNAAPMYKYDVGFVGSLYNDFRKSLESDLSRKYKYIRIGHPKEIRGKELVQYIQNTKIIIADGVYSPNCWSNRIYTTTGMGGFMLHYMVEGLEKEFDIEKEIGTYAYENINDLLRQIDYYIKNNNIREQMKKKANLRTKTSYTYSNKVKELINTINHENSILLPRSK